MSGSTIGGIAGAIVGSFFGAPQLGFMIGSMIGGYVDPEVIKQQGPRLDQASSQTARDGVPITYGFGTFPTHGNIIWRAPLVENVITTRERQGKGGGPVTQTTTYQYTRSFAIGICEGPITGLLIVKQNGAIVYDARPDAELLALGMDAQGIAASRAASAAFMRNKTLFLGTEDQMPWSVMEAHHGVGNVSGYRGLVYLCFEAEDLTDFRGAIPQYEFVVNAEGIVTSGPQEEQGLFRWWPLDDATEGGFGREVIAGDDGKYSNTDGIGSGPPLRAGSAGSLNMTATNDYFWTPDNSDPDGYPAGHFSVAGFDEWTVSVICQPAFEDPGSVEERVIFAYVDSALNGWVEWIISLKDGTLALTPRGAVGHGGTTTQVTGGDMVSVLFPTMIHLTWKSDTPGNPATTGTLKLYVNGVLVDTQLGSSNSGQTGDYIAVGGVEYDYLSGFVGYVSDLKIYNYALTAGEVEQKYLGVGDADLFREMPDAPGVYVDLDGNIVGASGEIIERDGVSVADIVTSVCQRHGIPASKIDVTDLADDYVIGFRVAGEGGGDGILSPLLMKVFADAGEWDGKLRFVKRGGAAQLAISADDLVERDGDAFEQQRVQEAELLRKNTVSYLDPAATFTVTTQSWERRAGTIRAEGEAMIEIPVVDTADEMARVAEKRGKIAWTETEKYTFGLPMPKFARVTPTTNLEVTDRAGVVHLMRVGQASEDSGVLLLEEAARYREPAYTGTVTGAVAPTLPGTSPPSPRGPTELRAINAPALRASDTTPGIYVAGTGFLAGWVGFDLYMSIDGSAESYVGRYLNRATMGYLTADVTSGDDTIPVRLFDGRTMETVTDEEFAANQNAWAIVTGNTTEIGASQTVTGTFGLSDTLRGQLGTLATSHSENDEFLVLDAAVYFVPIDPRYAGATLTLRAVSIGTAADDNDTVTLVYDPPVYVIDGNGDSDGGDDSPDPDPGGAGTPGTPTARTIGATVSTPSLTAGEAAAAANSAAINAAFAGLPGGGGIVRLPAGTFYIDTSDPIEPVSNSRLDCVTNSTTLRAKGSNTTTAPSVHRDIVRVDGVTEVEIAVYHFIGYRAYWAANGGASAFGISEWAHGIYVTGSSNVTIYNGTLENFVGDGISLGRTSHHIHVINILSTKNRRQGISTGSDDVLIENCTCSYIGLVDGTSPKAGIDIEVDLPDTNSAINVEVRGCTLTDNAGPGLIAYKSCNNLNIHDNTIERNVKGVYAYDSDNVDLHDNIIRYNATQGVHLAGTSSNWDLDGNTFFANSARQYGTPTSGATTTSPTTTQKAKHITVASTVTGTTYGTNTYGPV